MILPREIAAGKMRKGDGTEKSLDGKIAAFTEHKGHGSLSDRYPAEIDGSLCFVKTYHSAENCSGPASREINKNEIVVQDYVRQCGE